MEGISIDPRKYPHLFLFAILLWTFSCSPSTVQDQRTKTDLPWASTTPAEEGVSQAVIDSIHQEITDGKFGMVDRFFSASPWENPGGLQLRAELRFGNATA